MTIVTQEYFFVFNDSPCIKEQVSANLALNPVFEKMRWRFNGKVPYVSFTVDYRSFVTINDERYYSEAKRSDKVYYHPGCFVRTRQEIQDDPTTGISTLYTVHSSPNVESFIFSKNGFVGEYKPDRDIILSTSNHLAVKPDIMVNSGALQLALNSLKRGSVSQQEIALELEKTIAEIK